MKIKKIASLFLAIVVQSCETTKPYTKTVGTVDLDRYLGRWYVIANRPTMFEKDAYNATETYTLNASTGKIHVDFRYQKGGFDGDEKSVPQTAWVHNTSTNAHWKISLWWLPFNLDYLIIALDEAYQWTAVGVPNQKYLWIMSKVPNMSDEKLNEILQGIAKEGYDISNVNRVPQ